MVQNCSCSSPGGVIRIQNMTGCWERGQGPEVGLQGKEMGLVLKWSWGNSEVKERDGAR